MEGPLKVLELIIYFYRLNFLLHLMINSQSLMLVLSYSKVFKKTGHLFYIPCRESQENMCLLFLAIVS